MAKPKVDLLQGTLDMLILKIVALEPLHGYGIVQRIQQMSRDALQVRQGSLYPALYRLEGKGLLRMSEEALRESLGAAIRERRKGLGLTLAQMAGRTDVSLGYLSQIELGKNSASIETLYRICLALGIKMSELFQAVQKPL